MTFVVGDLVRVTRSNPNQTYYNKGREFVVGQVDTSTIHTYFIPKGENSYHRNRVTATNLELVKAHEPVAVLDWTHADDLAKAVVKVAKDLAEEHDWCDVVTTALIEMGLGAFVTTKKRVTLEVEVSLDGAPDDDDFVNFVKKSLPLGTEVTYSSVDCC